MSCEKALLSEMYTGMYNLKPGNRLVDAVREKPVACDAFLIRAVQELGERYSNASDTTRSIDVRKADAALLLVNVTEDLVRYTDKCVESIIEDTLNQDVFAKGLYNCYTERRLRMCTSLTPRKKFWLKKQSAPRANKGRDRAPCNKFNTEAGCMFANCRYRHVCSKCQSTAHGASACPGQTKAASSSK